MTTTDWIQAISAAVSAVAAVVVLYFTKSVVQSNELMAQANEQMAKAAADTLEYQKTAYLSVHFFLGDGPAIGMLMLTNLSLSPVVVLEVRINGKPAFAFTGLNALPSLHSFTERRNSEKVATSFSLLPGQAYPIAPDIAFDPEQFLANEGYKSVEVVLRYGPSGNEPLRLSFSEKEINTLGISYRMQS
ncbi:MAG: hypothetical protein SFU83_20090 [Meiothermus sp.]|nr:hypothetical protein [Meiothermus sp.]